MLRNPVVSWQEAHGEPAPPPRPLVSWPRDDAKLDRVRAAMAEQELDALVVRAPDNVLYLTNFWGMKGYDACVFPREGEPVLLCLEASAEDAARDRVDERRPLVRGYDETDPRPPLAARRSTLARRGVARATAASASSSRSARRRPTAWSASRRRSRRRWFDAWPDAVDATPLLAAARAIKTDQELERIRLANEICAAAMEHVRAELRARHEGERGGRALAGVRARRGHGLARPGRARARLLARLVGRRDPHVHRDRRPARERGRADAVRDLGLRRRLLVRPHEAPLPGRAARRLPRARGSGCSSVYGRAIDHCRPGRASPSSTC